ncbi:MAG: RNB domain-containing ribonuclease [Desulfovibrionaceae bacterium]|nr:RNB domain-containing ribonuclease [Desulfovibrionaceae bacterium]
MTESMRYPSEGCIVEYLEGNAVQIALVLEENEKRVRLLLPNRREMTLSRNRILPWIGPRLSGEGRDQMIRLLEEHHARRIEREASVSVLDLWEMASGEVPEAQANWFAELEEADPDCDTIAAYAHALLACKTHFRFQPPYFKILLATEAEKRVQEQKARSEREAIILHGRAFVQGLWDTWIGKRPLPRIPSQDVADVEGFESRLESLLQKRMRSPNGDPDTDELWAKLSRGLPDVPQLPLQLLLAWEKLPPHYNVWLETSGYASGDDWWKICADEVTNLAHTSFSDLPLCESELISIDSATTKDIDDAFALKETEDGWIVTVALAGPSLFWPFGSGLDNLVFDRGSSLYLPEMTCHMLPECLGADAFSLHAGSIRPACLFDVAIAKDGTITDVRPYIGSVRLAANLTYEDCDAVLLGQAESDNPALKFRETLTLAYKIAELRKEARIRDGAVVMERPEPHIELQGTGRETLVQLTCTNSPSKAQLIVSEAMIAACAGGASWAKDKGLPLLFRTQNVALPREFAGTWSAPERLAEIMHALLPSILEIEPKTHAALGVSAYAPLTSPLRRYADLVNLAQVSHCVREGSPLFSAEDLRAMVTRLGPALEQVGLVQRMRPRYWKLLYFQQKGESVWWPGVVTEENDAFVVVALPNEAISIRARRQLFDERVRPGTSVRVRIGRVEPYWNEIQIVDAMTDDGGVYACT